MSFFKPKFVLLVVVSALLPALWISGCTGDAFKGVDDSGAGGSSTSGGSVSNAGAGVIGTGAGTGVACDGPEDCDDESACTIDLCNADGTCDASPKCLGTQKCCDDKDGECAECCVNSDCDDGVSCTMNTCFSGQCMFVPNDTQCDPTQYCSVNDGCRARAACGILMSEAPDVCDDGSACTADSCKDNLCQHDYCLQNSEANLCCEGIGCAACCNDSQCNTGNRDPCKVGSCTDGKCSLVPLCGAGQECCPSADGLTATCGSCCSAAECDDNVGCTFDQCGGGQCGHTPTACPAGYVCDPVADCQKAATCTVNTDCRAGACQTNPKCDGGACHFDGCGIGTKCCIAGVAGATSSGCAICCGNAECTDNIGCTTDTCGAMGCEHMADSAKCAAGQVCDPEHGCVACDDDADCDHDKLPCTVDTCDTSSHTCNAPVSKCAPGEFCTIYGCSKCVNDSDCQGGVITANIILPTGCNWNTCEKGVCTPHNEPDCGDFQYCCPPYGCQLDCNIQTQ